jgi:DNA (cytosine-5)-methyltransferase 1
MVYANPPSPRKLRVVELFAGVGGFRLGLEGWQGMSACSNYKEPLRDSAPGFEVVWSNQWEPGTKRQHANEVYASKWPRANHCGDDITTVASDEIPVHDLLVGGFPCQDYSVAVTLNNSKGLRGKKGVLWWEIERIIRDKGEQAPRYLFLENVDRLLQSPATQRGRDFAIILASLADLGYAVEWRVINAADYGMPQRRRRTFFMGYREGTPEYARLKATKQKGDWIEDGIFGNAFPVTATFGDMVHEGKITGKLSTVSKNFNAGPSSKLTPFANAGVMIGRKFYTTKVHPQYDGPRTVLGDVLVPLRDVPAAYRIDKSDIKKWEYLKGSKKITRTNKKHGFEYVFAEGALSFPDPIDRPSRTVITGEGGAAPSRTKHAVQPGRTLRRLVPVELERLNMFPDDHTLLSDVPDGKRAFFMGNALVVGVIEKVGTALLESVSENVLVG